MSFTVAELLAELGGVARYQALNAVATRKEIEAAVEVGDVVRDGRGVYALADVDEADRVALRLGGVLSHASAALKHGWGVVTVPDKPHVTAPGVTLLHCLRTLPSREALAIADSALREDGCHQLLVRVAETARGRGAARVRAVAARASGKAANPFESAARDICDGVPGLRVEPQVEVGHGRFTARADLVDTRLRIVVECDSFEWHGSRPALVRDCRRYNRMVVGGWTVLRLSYEDVMFHPDEVREVLVEAVALAELLAKVGLRLGRAA